MEMDAAKRLLAPDTPLEAWHASGADGCPTVQLAADGAAVTVSSATASTRFVDNVPRIAVSALGDDGSGDSLPHTPVVLTGCCDRWPAWRGGSGDSWSAERLAARLPAATQVRLDGGPGFARESLCNPFVTLQAYAQYASTTQDSASLYVFDDKVLTTPFGDDAPFGGGAAAEGRSADELADLVARAHARRRGRRASSKTSHVSGAAPVAESADSERRQPRCLAEEYSTPRCFGRDAQARLDYLLPTAYYLLPTTYYLLPTAYYLLPTAYYLLPTTYYLPLTHPSRCRRSSEGQASARCPQLGSSWAPRSPARRSTSTPPPWRGISCSSAASCGAALGLP